MTAPAVTWGKEHRPTCPCTIWEPGLGVQDLLGPGALMVGVAFPRGRWGIPGLSQRPLPVSPRAVIQDQGLSPAVNRA